MEVEIHVGILKNMKTASKAPIPAEIPKKAESAAGLLLINCDLSSEELEGRLLQPSNGCDSVLSWDIVGVSVLEGGTFEAEACADERTERDALSIVVIPLAPTEKRRRT